MFFRVQPKSRIRALGILVLILILVSDWYYYHNKIYPGVYFYNLPLGGKTLTEAAAMITELELTLVLPDNDSFSLPLTAAGVEMQTKTITDAAFRQGRQLKWPWNYLERFSLQCHRHYLIPVHRLNEEQWHKKLTELSASLTKLPVNAQVQISGSQTAIIPEQAGYEIKAEELDQYLRHYLQQPQNSTELKIPVKMLQPAVTREFLTQKKIAAERGSFTTTFDAAQTERAHNIHLAGKLINGTVVAAGETFSLNGFLGDTTAEKGYKKAPIIVGESLVPGYGGGICQVSSTLYNAALLAGLEIIERHPHGMTVPYIVPGKDATIAYPDKDLKFRNNTHSDIVIAVELTPTDITFKILGAAAEDEIQIESKILKVLMPPKRYLTDPELEPGQEKLVEGEPGYLVEARRIFLRNGKEVKNELLSVDRYAPYPILIYRSKN
ncbi:MAG: hypothetical protein GX922_08110 [Firmicutes bacterium]|nr:hypothetical protein [Bacillota bacterium]